MSEVDAWLYSLDLVDEKVEVTINVNDDWHTLYITKKDLDSMNFIFKAEQLKAEGWKL